METTKVHQDSIGYILVSSNSEDYMSYSLNSLKKLYDYYDYWTYHGVGFWRCRLDEDSRLHV